MHRTLDVEELCRRYGPMVLRRCRQLLRNEDEAMDACQDVFVRLLERGERLDSRPTNLVDEFCFLLAYSPDRRHFPTAKDNGVAIWDTFSNPPRQRLVGQQRWPFTVTFSPDGKKVAAGGVGGDVIVWDV